MSTAMEKPFNGSLKAAGATDSLNNWAFGDFNAANVKPGVVQFDSAKKRQTIYAGGKHEEVAFLSDINKIGRWRGGLDATTGIPTVAGSTAATGDDYAGSPIEAGDRWIVTNAGTITGLGNSDACAALDIITAIKDNAASAAEFVNGKADIATIPSGFIEKKSGVNVVADTELTVTATVLTDVTGAFVRDATGVDSTAELKVTYAGKTVKLLSSVDISGLEVRMVGEI